MALPEEAYEYRDEKEHESLTEHHESCDIHYDLTPFDSAELVSLEPHISTLHRKSAKLLVTVLKFGCEFIATLLIGIVLVCFDLRALTIKLYKYLAIVHLNIIEWNILVSTVTIKTMFNLLDLLTSYLDLPEFESKSEISFGQLNALYWGGKTISATSGFKAIKANSPKYPDSNQLVNELNQQFNQILASSPQTQTETTFKPHKRTRQKSIRKKVLLGQQKFKLWNSFQKHNSSSPLKDVLNQSYENLNQPLTVMKNHTSAVFSPTSLKVGADS